MLSPEFHQTLATKTRILNLIWGAFSVACLFYVAISWIMFEQPGSNAAEAGAAAESDPMLTIIFAVVGMSMLGASIFAERIMLAPAKLAPHVQQAPSAAAVFALSRTGTSAPNSGQLALFAGLTETEKRLAGLSGVYQTALIVIWALREGIVVLGLVLAVMQSSFQAILPFAAVGLVTMLLKVPRPVAFYESQLDHVRKYL